MASRREIILKWIIYAFAALVLSFLHSLLFGRLVLFGVLPFLPPLLVALPASFEDTFPSALFGLFFGVACDLMLPAPLPCLFTLAFTLSALAAALIAQYLIQPGFFCSFAATAATFCILHLFYGAAQLMGGASLSAVVSLGLRETLVSSLWLLLYYPIFRTLRNVFEF